jgi:hypothetical protein
LKYFATGASSYCNIFNTLEAQEVNFLAGQTVIFSVYIQANSTFNGTINVVLNTNTSSNTQNAGTWTALATTSVTPQVGSYKRYSVSATVPAGTAGLQVGLQFPSGVASGSIVYYSKAQLELGSVATTFTRAGGTLQGELAACQRYFFLTSSADGAYTQYGTGQAFSTSAAKFSVNFPTAMRIAPTSVTATGNIGALNATNTAITSGTITVDSNSNYRASLVITGSGGIVAGNATAIMSNGSTSTSLSFSAEL